MAPPSAAWRISLALLAAAMVGPGAGADLCSRNGVALPGGGCRCDAAWAGGECGTLNLLPALANNLGTIYPGPDSHSTSSWGGTVSKGEDGLFHLLVSEMLGGCGLGAWQRNSAVRHATSPTIDGVYTPREIVLGAFAHNAACMDASPAGGPQCVLLHIGGGTHDPVKHPVQSNCTGGFTPPAAGDPGHTASRSHHSVADASMAPPPPPPVYPVMQSFKPGGGPWGNATLSCSPDASNSTRCQFDNPSGWVDPDGTAWLNYVLRGSHVAAGRGGYGFGLAKAPHWSGPYSPVAPAGAASPDTPGRGGGDAAPGYWDQPVLPSAGTAKQNCEDSVLFRDTRGDFHMLFHYFGLGNSDHGDHGGHAHAGADGRGWAFSEGHAWNLTVSFGAGNSSSIPAVSPAQYGYRQRPHVIVSEAGRLTHLITGVVFDASRPYPSPACTRCTGTHGPCDRSWTTIQPLATEAL